ncbi:hypothetical protein [Giesbergeria sinuosa]
MAENIIAGLISGLLATILVFVFRSAWSALIIPWFEERIYKDVRIEGSWYSLYPSSSDVRQEVITLQRRGHAITGTIICSSGNDSGEKYQVSGSFRNMLLPLTYESADLTKTDRGSITLKAVHNGERLAGKIAMYNTFEDSVETANIVWFRYKPDLDKYILDLAKKKPEITELRKQSRRIDKELKLVEGVIEKMPEELEKQSDTEKAVQTENSANNK